MDLNSNSASTIVAIESIQPRHFQCGCLERNTKCLSNNFKANISILCPIDNILITWSKSLSSLSFNKNQYLKIFCYFSIEWPVVELNVKPNGTIFIYVRDSNTKMPRDQLEFKEAKPQCTERTNERTHTHTYQTFRKKKL